MRKILNNNDKMKPLKYKEPNLKRKIIIVTLVFSVLLISGMCLYKAFAAFNEQKQFNVINGTVSDPGDIYFAYYVDDKITRDIPTQDSGYTLDTTKSTCTNGVTVGWDQTNWTALVNYQKYNATNNTRTKCDLYFKQALYCDLHSDTMACQITTLAQTDTTNLATDEAGNVRYIGADPNNYVSFDGDIWRIIGVMKNVDDGSGNKENRVKIIRSTSIGDYSWDTSESSINKGWGVNEWSQADLMKLLNPGYESESVGGSLYWNNQSGTCYSGQNNGTKACDFTSTGIKEKLKNMLGNAVWNTGSNGSSYSYDNIKTAKFYELERGSNTGKICTSGNYCNDTVARTTTWTGKIGLMYPSDYGYATSGGSTTDRATCLNTKLYSWNSSNVSDCKNNDWLFNSNYQWTISPRAFSSGARYAFLVISNGPVNPRIVCDGYGVRPVVYLSSNVGVQSGDGTSSDPFVLSEK